MNNFDEFNFVDMPTWVEDYNSEYKKYRNTIKNSQKAFFFVILLAIIVLFFNKFITIQLYVIITSILILLTIRFVLKTIKYPFKSYEFLSSVIYETGFLLHKNSDPKPQIYAEKMNTLLGNWNLFIGKIEKSIITSFYVINIRLLCEKLRTLVRLLNEYAKNYNQYSMNKNDISIQLMGLAYSIYNEKEDINKHIKLTDLLIKSLQKDNLQEKPLKIPFYDSFKENINRISIMTPQYIKLTITAIFVFIVVFISIYIMGLWIDIEKEQLFSTSVAAAVLSIPIVMSIIRKQIQEI